MIKEFENVSLEYLFQLMDTSGYPLVCKRLHAQRQRKSDRSDSLIEFGYVWDYIPNLLYKKTQ